MERTLYLTAAETKAFTALPEGLRDGWALSQETLDCYESLRQIAMRYSLLDFTMHPDLQGLAKKLASGEKPHDVSIKNFDSSVQHILYFLMGARGVNALIQDLLRDMKNDEDVALLAGLSVIRHTLLGINSKTVPV